MPKNAFLGLRLSPELKKQLEIIAEREGRTVSQVSEALLRGGVSAYKEEGSKYIQQSLSRRSGREGGS